MPLADSATALPPHPSVKFRRRGRRRGGRLQYAFEILWAGMIVAVVCSAGMVALSWLQSQGAVAVVRQQASEIRAGKLDQAYGLFSSEYRSAMTLPMFRRWLRRQPALAGIQNLHIWGRWAGSGTAVLSGSFQDDFGHSYPVRYSLIRENGDWRIDSFQVREEVPESLPNIERFHYI
jgi:hypothetical protein